MAITFGASGGFGAVSGWQLQSANYTEQSERANAVGPTGNESNSELYDKRKNWTCNYKADKNLTAAAPTVPATIGAVMNSILLTSIQISTGTSDFATMTLSGHAHTDGTDGVAACKSLAHGITMTSGFGANAFGWALTGGTIESGNITISCDHAETKGPTGDTAAGENHNPRIEVSLTFLGGGTLVPVASYDVTSNDVSTDNAGFDHTAISAIKPLAFV